MALQVPKYLQVSDIQNPIVRYEWDDWQDLPALDVPDDAIGSRLVELSKRAVLAFMCGTAEWIVYRYAKLCDISIPWSYLEAAWAMIIDVHYGDSGGAVGWEAYTTETEAEWRGPVKQPIADALLRLEPSIQELALYATDPVGDASVLATLAKYVLPQISPFEDWANQVLDRLEAIYPIEVDDELGDAIPRPAIDPEFPFRLDESEVLINRFLSSLDYRSNKFLSTPEGMLNSESELAFTGVPYEYRLEEDRRARQPDED
jgi:hypothetical protein